MKNSKAILLAIFASAFAVLTVVNMSLASPKSAGENTLDMLEIMTRAFDESEGGEGSENCSPNDCTTPYEQWYNHTRLKGKEVTEHVVMIDGGLMFREGDQPSGATIIAEWENCKVGFTWECGFSISNKCCPDAQIHCHYGYSNCDGSGGPA